ncbi:DUF7674 family protein [Fusibacter sp. JL216-2]|uniref:DUF7674 family protein n=1 Tax=Fusibacter sp. JL216-2 TaxID=3071453 RepID=UPI003D342346
MIQKDEVLTGLLHNLPDTYADHRMRDRNRMDLYGGVDIISDAIVNSLGREDTQNFMWLFALIEKYLKEGDKEVKELLSYGLIDHLQESLIKKRMKLSALDPWLRDETKDVWQSMIDIWSQADRPEE